VSDINFSEIRKELDERKIELEAKLTELSKEKTPNDIVLEPGDMATASTMESLKISLQEAEKREYERILQALSKIDDGTYGLCVDCGRQIGERRLKNNPNSSRCLTCQEAFEESNH
jgi:DnaK suppressor protein